MALMDMIMESMIDQPDQSFMEMHQREEAAEDKMAMESLGGFGDLPSADEDIARAPETVPAVENECRVMSAESFLSAMESHMEIRGSLEPATESCVICIRLWKRVSLLTRPHMIPMLNWTISPRRWLVSTLIMIWIPISLSLMRISKTI